MGEKKKKAKTKKVKKDKKKKASKKCMYIYTLIQVLKNYKNGCISFILIQYEYVTIFYTEMLMRQIDSCRLF